MLGGYQWPCNAGAVAVLADALRDAAEKVRRRAAATLGELLFYIAMQPPVRAAPPRLRCCHVQPGQRRMLS